MRGRIKRISSKQGMGFITTDDGSEIYFDKYSLMGVNIESFNEGDQVEYEIEVPAKAPKAVKIQITFWPPVTASNFSFYSVNHYCPV